MSAPEATVVIPTHDRWPLLSRRALPSALAQEDVELEVVVVDEASSDGTREGLEEYDDARLRIVRHDVPRRLPGARNAGVAVAGGRWLAFLDDDDVWAPRKLRVQIDAAEAASADWAYGRAVVVDGELRPLEDDPFPAPEELEGLLDGGNWIPGGGSNVVVRAEAFHAAGGFDEALRFFEDWDLWLRLLDRGRPASVDAVVMARVEHGANMAVRDRDEVAAAYERMMRKHRAVTDDDRRGVLEWLATEQHRAGRRLAASRMFAGVALRYRSPGNIPPAVAALFGRRAMSGASWALERFGGGTHLDLARSTPGADPDWLVGYR
jgi:glycosyltransferase involved in cell wall biosynthesis